MRKSNNALPAEHVLVLGASDMGKSSVIKTRLAQMKPKRALAWDYKNEYPDEGFTPVNSIGELARILKTAKTGKFCYCGDDEEFPAFCQLVWGWGDCVAIFEEMGTTVATQGKAMGYLGKIYRVGRGYGIKTFATTQSPQEIPKTVQQNASESFVFALGTKAGRKRVVDDLDLESVDLLPSEPLQFLHWKRKKRAISANSVSYVRNKPRIRKVADIA